MNNQVSHILNHLFMENTNTDVFELDTTTDVLYLTLNGIEKNRNPLIFHDFFKCDLSAVLKVHQNDIAMVRSRLLNASRQPRCGSIIFQCAYFTKEYLHYKLQYKSFYYDDNKDKCCIIGIITNIQGEMNQKSIMDIFSSKMENIDGIVKQNMTVSQQIFEVLYNTPDVSKAIELVLEMLGKAFHVDRVYIFEDDENHQYCRNTFEWCSSGVTSQKENLQHISYKKDLGGVYQNNFDKDGAFICSDVSFLPKDQYEILAAQEIKSMLQCAIMENNVYSGCIGFDDCKENRDWPGEQLHTLMFSAKIVGTFLFKLRREEALVKANNELHTLIDRIPGGAGIYELKGEQFCQLYLNDGYYKLLGDTRENRSKYTGYHYFDAIHKDDLINIHKAITAIIHGTTQIDIMYRCINVEGNYIWLRMVGHVYKEDDGRILLYCTHSNVDEHAKEMISLRETKSLLSLAMQGDNLMSWEYDAKEHRMVLSEEIRKITGLPQRVDDVPESLIQSDYVHPNSISEYRKLYTTWCTIDNPTIQQDICVKNAERTEYIWRRMVLTYIFDPNGNYVKTIGTSRDITEQKRTEAKYQQQLQELETSNQPNLIAKSWYNLSKNTRESINIQNDSSLENSVTVDYDDGLRLAASICISHEKAIELLSTFNRQHLMDEYRNGNFEFSVEYQRYGDNGEIIWVVNQSKTFEEPLSSDIMCFIYCYDITEQKHTKEMIDAVVKLDYDYLALVDCKENKYFVYAKDKNETSVLPPMHSTDYDQEIKDYANEYLVPKDIEQYIYNMSIENIRYQLKDKEKFTFFTNVRNKNGNIYRKKFQFSYFDQATGMVLLSQADITEIYNREQQKVKELEVAKEVAEKAKIAAEEANCEKSRFLSRMSHDLRTPMNVIIGLTALARDEVTNPETVNSMLEQINHASKFLLGLVNDCLDLEKIEGGKLELHLESYSFSEFLNSIRTMVEPLCIQKGIKFIIYEANPINPTIITDKVRLEQIFFNLLSNSVKFTPTGGEIKLLLDMHSFNNQMISLECCIADNGIGITKKFQEHMFEPFTQESNEVQTQSGGSGLGLAIVKYLVDMLKGTITVQSIPGKETKFKLHFDFLLNQEKTSTDKKVTDLQNFDSLQGKHILLAEDHPLNTLIAVKLLEKKKMRVTTASTGKHALETIASSDNQFFDAILMDIRMPEMDGLEATKAIRALNREDAKTIPIIAMSANAFQEDISKSVNVGMNDYLSKPIEPEKMYTVLAKYINN